MLKLEALDRNCVRSIRIKDNVIYAEASIDWPERFSTESADDCHPAFKIKVEAEVDLADFTQPKKAVDVALFRAVALLQMAYAARFPEPLGTFDEAVMAKTEEADEEEQDDAPTVESIDAEILRLDGLLEEIKLRQW